MISLPVAAKKNAAARRRYTETSLGMGSVFVCDMHKIEKRQLKFSTMVSSKYLIISSHLIPADHLKHG